VRATADRLPWIAVLLTLATAVVLMLGPLWSSAEGENPLERPPGVDVDAVLLLGLPTVVVLASLAVALAGRERRVVGALALLVLGYAVLRAPAPLPVWFLPSLLATAAGYAVLLASRGGAREAPDLR
jgi:hypothetical protein